MKHIVHFTGAEGNALVADSYGETGRPVLLLHGGGQTRHAWGGAARAIAAAGYRAFTLDQRGHGDSAWAPQGHYRYAHFAADITKLADELAATCGARPAVITASFAGLTALLAAGRAQRAGRDLFAALVLVDMALSTDPEGVRKIQGFMRAHAAEGFADVEAAADAVAAYMPHRPRPSASGGLRKNLRLHPDGRWRWHWDPLFMDGADAIDIDRDEIDAELRASAAALRIPLLLVRGASSELISEANAEEFRSIAPAARYVDVHGARHMVAGDANDQFTIAVVEFLAEVLPGLAGTSLG